ncbi:MAG: DUF1223 domain-containing protein [Pseudotabrizicola sp.]|nr:DUF1223 domain-containing protein [Pseudotabrizicola sp.]MDO8883029.1 DUF1223 domain-containing protein [Pseudotabrizicola sp.]MDP2083138.1 DUF1223 domain-containing protein [Pseudotabrizicola sp.]MDZ7572556.1 DUF1223 domain-containing protein [Pseudotabrizicola sp.]
MRHLVSATLGLWIGVSGAALAQTSPVVVELYTSQGCSSCPPADEFMEQLVKSPDVIALSLHVDYWDYIGWRDTFGNPAFTQRQKAYAKAVGSRMIYTPQMIVGGQDRVEGNDPAQVAEAIRRHQAQVSPVRLSVTRDGDRIVIKAEANPPLSKNARIQVIRYTPEATVAIGRGENEGREVTYTNIVTDWRAIADWPGVTPFEMTAEVSGSDPVVVIVQTEGPANVLAAAVVK